MGIFSTPISMSIRLCYHCGNKTQMNLSASYEYEVSFEEHGHRCLYHCPVCDGVTLLNRSWDFFNDDPKYDDINETVLYPAVSLESKDVPKEIGQAFEAALKVKNIDGAICTLSLRRTLEMLCNDKNASGKDLFAKLRDLASKGVLPPILNGMADTLRVLGNSAAHADDATFSNHLISSLIDFTQAILDYVYILPQKTVRRSEKHRYNQSC